MFHKFYKILIVLVAVVAIGCVRGATDDRPVLCVSIEPQRSMLEELAGDNYRVVTILSRGDDPESYEPTMGQRLAISDAAAYMTTGQLPFEQSLARTAAGETRVIDTSRGVGLLHGTHGHDSGGCEMADPHIWTSARNAIQMAANMRDALIQIDPDNAAAYSRRYSAMAARLDSLDNAIAARLDSADVRAFAIWHPSLSYYANDYGLHQIAVSQENKELSIGDMRDVIDRARAEGVRVFLHQRELDSRQARTINDEIGTRLVVIDPMAYDWEEQLKQITDELAR